MLCGLCLGLRRVEGVWFGFPAADTEFIGRAAGAPCEMGGDPLENQRLPRLPRCDAALVPRPARRRRPRTLASAGRSAAGCWRSRVEGCGARVGRRCRGPGRATGGGRRVRLPSPGGRRVGVCGRAGRGREAAATARDALVSCAAGQRRCAPTRRGSARTARLSRVHSGVRGRQGLAREGEGCPGDRSGCSGCSGTLWRAAGDAWMACPSAPCSSISSRPYVTQRAGTPGTPGTAAPVISHHGARRSPGRPARPTARLQQEAARRGSYPAEAPAAAG